MGYDCTLHVLDENAVLTGFVPRLLNESPEKSSFDQREDSYELWAAVKDSLAELNHGNEVPRRCATLIGQLAIAYVAAELPYHYERGFCLSMWEEQEESVFAKFPKKFRGNPGTLFSAIIAKHPALAGEFPNEIESNFCPGIYIPKDQVPAALKWIIRKVNSFPKPDRRLFRGLILVMREAARLGLAYWEGTDLPVPMATMHPPEAERTLGLEEWKNPDGIYMEFLQQEGPMLVFAHSIGFPQDCRTVHISLRNWPPKTATTWNEYAVSASRSVSGRWVTASMTRDEEFMYRARVRDSVDSEPAVLKMSEERKNGLLWAGFLGDRIVAVLRSVAEYPNWDQGDFSAVLTPAYPLIEESGRLVAIDRLSASDNKHPNVGALTLLDGTDVFFWDSIGYEIHGGSFAPAFKIPGRFTHDHCAVVRYGADSVFCSCDIGSGKIDELTYVDVDQGLFQLGRAHEPVHCLPKVTRIRGITHGPSDSILVHELNERTDLGKLFFPADGTYVRIEPDLFADEDPSHIRSLHYVDECKRLIAATPERLWAISIDKVLDLPRYNGATGRLIRSKLKPTSK